jgi:hypothetical protein
MISASALSGMVTQKTRGVASLQNEIINGSYCFTIVSAGKQLFNIDTNDLTGTEYSDTGRAVSFESTFSGRADAVRPSHSFINLLPKPSIEWIQVKLPQTERS